MFSSYLRAGIGLVVLGIAAGCGGSSSQSPSTTQAERSVTIDGSSTVFPITEAVAEEFQKATPGIRVTVGISGTGGGFQKFCRAETDISDASRPIQPTEMEACKQAGIEFIELPVAFDGIAIITHPNAKWVDNITVAELKTMWAPEAQGTVTRWSQVRKGWPDRELHLFGAGVDSGTYDYFTQAVNGKEGASRGDFTSSEDDNVLVQGVASDELALGFLPFAYFDENKEKLKLIPVDDGKPDNGAGPLLPSIESIRTGTYQPLARPIFIYVAVPSLKKDHVKQFVDFYIAQGGKLAEEVGYVPLGDAAYKLVAEHLAGGKTGTVFGKGGSTVGITIEELLNRERTR
jgi:phosphate transport system substrate-binding protein